MPKNLRSTAAWRISVWTTLAFALGTAAAFSIVYFLVAQGIRERSDTWLSGEAEVLAQVSADTPSDRLYTRIVREVAELATQEVPDERNARGERLNSVFFLVTDPINSGSPLWVGPSSQDAFVTAIRRSNLVPGPPKSITVEGYRQTFRVVEK
ncbi:MAG: two-component sensor histidine kinase, partial [Candidatus Sulfotelmatobacter sp.]